MRVGRGALLMTLALGACRPGASTEVTEAKDAGAIGPPGRPSPLTLPACDVLLPADLRDLTLNGFTMKEDRGCPTCGPVCTLRSAALPEVSVSVAYDCQPGYANADVRALLAPMLNAGGEEVSALGKAAARRNPVQGMTQVVAWDDDTPCVVVVTWLGDDPDRAMDVARLAVTAHQAVEDAGTVLPRLEGDSPLGDAPLEPLDTLTQPRAGTTDVLSAPAGSRPRPSVAPAVVPPPRRPRMTAPVGTGPAPGSVAPPQPPTGLAPGGVTPAPTVTPPRPVSTTPRHEAVPAAPTTVPPAPTTVPPAPTPVTPAPTTAPTVPTPVMPAPTTVTPAPTTAPTVPTPVTPAPKTAPTVPTPVTPAPTPEPKPVTPAPTAVPPASGAATGSHPPGLITTGAPDAG
ncbi:hypothetical protein [Corallococcus sp. CA053C]|uniref:hypothetical protein n=1 Tax=Corallococcus sp. CA053C TaxID=2316732 RepID=UPI0018F64FC3|nr:hypothetical protein [Corallococcus sp. CA053C]